MLYKCYPYALSKALGRFHSIAARANAALTFPAGEPAPLATGLALPPRWNPMHVTYPLSPGQNYLQLELKEEAKGSQVLKPGPDVSNIKG